MASEETPKADGNAAFQRAYDAVEVELPGGKIVRCKDLDISGAARFMGLLKQMPEGDALEALAQFVTEFPTAIDAVEQMKGLAFPELLEVFIGFLAPPSLDLEDASDSGNGKHETIGLDDLVFDYAAAYGGPPRRDLPWSLFLAGVRRVKRFEARQLLAVMDGTAWGAGSVLGADSGRLETLRSTIHNLAYKGKAEPELALKQSKD